MGKVNAGNASYNSWKTPPMSFTVCPKCSSKEITDVGSGCELLGIQDDIGKQWLCDTCGYAFDDEDTKEDEWYNGADFSIMSVSKIADVILSNWKRKIDPSAFPYVQAMLQIEKIDDQYGNETGRDVVLGFLTNAQKWKGDIARQIKKELRKRAG